MAANLPACPQSLKAIQHYLKTASEHEQRDIVVTYWSRLYALQTALKIDKKSEDARMLLVALMDWLEKTKISLADNEAITNEVAAQAHIENYALKLFSWADNQDRSGIFNKNVVKAFYSAGMLMDILLTFGEHTEEIARNCKYAKWKAAYIHNCLKNGETPIPGPMQADSEINGMESNPSYSQQNPSHPTNIGFQIQPTPQVPSNNNTSPSVNTNFDPFPPQPQRPISPASVGQAPKVNPAPSPTPERAPHGSSSVLKFDPSLISKAQKYCKFAGSALNYDDIPEAINNLEKALHLLRTGQDS